MHLRKACAGTLRAVAKHSAELATCVTETCSPDVFAVLLEDACIDSQHRASPALMGRVLTPALCGWCTLLCSVTPIERRNAGHLDFYDSSDLALHAEDVHKSV